MGKKVRSTLTLCISQEAKGNPRVYARPSERQAARASDICSVLEKLQSEEKEVV